MKVCITGHTKGIGQSLTTIFDSNHHQIIGRFRVLKTDILKIDEDNLSIDNYKTFQNHLKDIIVSYNAFVNIMNLEVTKDNNEDFMKD